MLISLLLNFIAIATKNLIVTVLLSQNKISSSNFRFQISNYQAPFEFDIWDLELILNFALN